MTYRVELSARAQRDLVRLYEAIYASDFKQARTWFNGLETVVSSLSEYPRRGSAVAEDRALRQLFYGEKPDIYRIIYATDEQKRSVTVIHIRHGARRPVTRPAIK